MSVGNVNAMTNYAVLHMNGKNYELALKYAFMSYNINYGLRVAKIIAKCYELQSDTEKMIKWYNYNMDYGCVYSMYKLEKYYKTVEKNNKKMLDHFNNASCCNYKNASYQLGLYYTKLGEHDNAIHYYRLYDKFVAKTNIKFKYDDKSKFCKKLTEFICNAHISAGKEITDLILQMNDKIIKSLGKYCANDDKYISYLYFNYVNTKLFELLNVFDCTKNENLGAYSKKRLLLMDNEWKTICDDNEWIFYSST